MITADTVTNLNRLHMSIAVMINLAQDRKTTEKEYIRNFLQNSVLDGIKTLEEINKDLNLVQAVKHG